MIACFTGHRPEKVGGYQSSPLSSKVKQALREAILEAIGKGYRTFISGGALGVDQWAAEIVLELKKDHELKLIIARPFPSQDKVWPEASRNYFRNLCSQADEVRDISPDPFANWKMQARNEFMIKESSLVIAVYDGSPGGTANALKSAEKKNKQTVLINPKKL